MKRSIFKPIVFGVLFGAAVFFMPFMLLKFIFFFMFIGAIFRMFAWRRFRHGGMSYHAMYADKIRSMSEEEYSEFKNKTQDCYNHYNYRGCHNYYNDCNDDWSNKKEKSTDPEKK